MGGANCIGLCGLLTLAAAASGAPADELRARIAELEQKSARDDSRIAELEARLSSIEAATGENWLTEQRAAEIRNLVADVLADADTRASMLTRALDAGYDDGAVIESGNGNWRLQTNILMQHRFILNHQSGSTTDSSRWGFENTRTKFILSGNVVVPEWFYRLEIEVGSINTGLPNGESRTGLGDALIGYEFDKGWKIGGGTFKTPLLREELVESDRQLAVERSLVNYLFTGGRTDGIAVEYRTENLRFVGSFNNGIDDGLYGGDLATGGTSALALATADFAFTIRGEYLIEGESWDQFQDFTSFKDDKTAVMIGGAIHYQTADDDAPGVADIDLLVLTLDFSGEFSGRGNVFAAVVFSSADVAAGTDIDAVALVLQGGLRFDDDWEGFCRYEYSDSDDLAAANLNVLTAGVTRYFAGQRAKWTTDIGIGIDRVAVTVPVAAWRADPAGEDGQVVIRSQIQLVF